MRPGRERCAVPRQTAAPLVRDSAYHKNRPTRCIDKFHSCRAQSEKERPQRRTRICENPPVTFPRQIDLKNVMLLFKLRRATLLTFVEDRAEKCERESQEEKKRRDDIRKNSNVRIL